MPRANRGAYLIFVRKRASFYIQWYEGGAKRQLATGTDDRSAAEAALASFITERQRRERPIGPSDPSSFPIELALALYGAEHAPTTAAPERIGHAIDALAGFWGTSTADAITEATCRAYLKHRARSAGTVRRELGVLRAALFYAHRHGRITRVPHVFLPEKPDGKDRWLTRSEAARLLAAALHSRSDARLYLPLFILMGLYTGQRKEAILSLRWPQVSFGISGRIDFNPPGRKRTNKGRAVIPMPEKLTVHLRHARERGSDLGYVLHRDGHRLGDLKRSFATACTDAGLDDVTPHTLRHTCGTWLAQKGVPMFQIAGWLGQSNARTTELYAHHHPDFFAAAKRAIDGRSG